MVSLEAFCILRALILIEKSACIASIVRLVVILAIDPEDLMCKLTPEHPLTNICCFLD